MTDDLKPLLGARCVHASVPSLVDGQRVNSDLISAFLDDACVVSGDQYDSLSARELINGFNAWLAQRGESRWMDRTVQNRLKSRAGVWWSGATGETFQLRRSQGVLWFEGIRFRDRQTASTVAAADQPEVTKPSSSTHPASDKAWPRVPLMSIAAAGLSRTSDVRPSRPTNRTNNPSCPCCTPIETISNAARTSSVVAVSGERAMNSSWMASASALLMIFGIGFLSGSMVARQSRGTNRIRKSRMRGA